MNKTNRQELVQYLKIKHNLAIGEKTLDTLINKINKAANTKLKVSGRSYKTGRKKTIVISVKRLYEIIKRCV